MSDTLEQLLKGLEAVYENDGQVFLYTFRALLKDGQTIFSLLDYTLIGRRASEIGLSGAELQQAQWEEVGRKLLDSPAALGTIKRELEVLKFLSKEPIPESILKEALPLGSYVLKKLAEQVSTTTRDVPFNDLEAVLQFAPVFTPEEKSDLNKVALTFSTETVREYEYGITLYQPTLQGLEFALRTLLKEGKIGDDRRERLVGQAIGNLPVLEPRLSLPILRVFDWRHLVEQVYGGLFIGLASLRTPSSIDPASGTSASQRLASLLTDLDQIVSVPPNLAYLLKVATDIRLFRRQSDDPSKRDDVAEFLSKKLRTDPSDAVRIKNDAKASLENLVRDIAEPKNHISYAVTCQGLIDITSVYTLLFGWPKGTAVEACLKPLSLKYLQRTDTYLVGFRLAVALADGSESSINKADYRASANTVQKERQQLIETRMLTGGAKMQAFENLAGRITFLEIKFGDALEFRLEDEIKAMASVILAINDSSTMRYFSLICQAYRELHGAPPAKKLFYFYHQENTLNAVETALRRKVEKVKQENERLRLNRDTSKPWVLQRTTETIVAAYKAFFGEDVDYERKLWSQEGGQPQQRVRQQEQRSHHPTPKPPEAATVVLYLGGRKFDSGSSTQVFSDLEKALGSRPKIFAGEVPGRGFMPGIVIARNDYEAAIANQIVYSAVQSVQFSGAAPAELDKSGLTATTTKEGTTYITARQGGTLALYQLKVLVSSITGKKQEERQTAEHDRRNQRYLADRTWGKR